MRQLRRQQGRWGKKKRIVYITCTQLQVYTNGMEQRVFLAFCPLLSFLLNWNPLLSVCVCVIMQGMSCSTAFFQHSSGGHQGRCRPNPAKRSPHSFVMYTYYGRQNENLGTTS